MSTAVAAPPRQLRRYDAVNHPKLGGGLVTAAPNEKHPKTARVTFGEYLHDVPVDELQVIGNCNPSYEELLKALVKPGYAESLGLFIQVLDDKVLLAEAVKQ